MCDGLAGMTESVLPLLCGRSYPSSHSATPLPSLPMHARPCTHLHRVRTMALDGDGIDQSAVTCSCAVIIVLYALKLAFSVHSIYRWLVRSVFVANVSARVNIVMPSAAYASDHKSVPATTQRNLLHRTSCHEAVFEATAGRTPRHWQSGLRMRVAHIDFFHPLVSCLLTLLLLSVIIETIIRARLNWSVGTSYISSALAYVSRLLYFATLQQVIYTSHHSAVSISDRPSNVGRATLLHRIAQLCTSIRLPTQHLRRTVSRRLRMRTIVGLIASAGHLTLSVLLALGNRWVCVPFDHLGSHLLGWLSITFRLWVLQPQQLSLRRVSPIVLLPEVFNTHEASHVDAGSHAHQTTPSDPDCASLCYVSTSQRSISLDRQTAPCQTQVPRSSRHPQLELELSGSDTQAVHPRESCRVLNLSLSAVTREQQAPACRTKGCCRINREKARHTPHSRTLTAVRGHR